MKKTKFLIVGVSSAAVVLAVGAMLAASPLKLTADAVSHTAECEIHHYAQVDPAFGKNGAKEYWICCNHHNGPEFEAPTVGHITDATHEAGFIDTLDDDDPRIIGAYRKAIDFEDGKIPSFMHMAKGSAEVSTESASKGSKALKVTGAFKLAFDMDYLNALFGADSTGEEVLMFDARSTEYRGDLYYSSKAGNYGVYRYDQVNNIGNDGLRSNWKTFAFKKEFVSDLANGELIRTDSASGTVYIDNIRIAKPYSKAEFISFEDESIHENKVIPLGRSWTDEMSFTREGSNPLTVEISDAYASEGHNSVHITTTDATKVSAFISADMYNATDVGFLFDFYTPDGAAITNIQNRYRSEGGNVYYAPQNYTTAGKWITFFAPKSAVYDNDFMLFRCCNAIVNDFYLDNVRIADPEIDFENGVVTNFGGRLGYTPNYGGKYLATDASLGAKNGSDIWFYSNFQVAIDDTMSTRGSHSINAKATAAYGGLYISKRMYDLMPDAGVMLDIYTDAAVNFNSLVSGQSGVHDWTPGQWITITVPKSYIGTNGSGEYCLFTYGAAINSWIDNVRMVDSSTSEMNPQIVDGPSYNWYN